MNLSYTVHPALGGGSRTRFGDEADENGSLGHDSAAFRRAGEELPREYHGVGSGGQYAPTAAGSIGGAHGPGVQAVSKECSIDGGDGPINPIIVQSSIEEPMATPPWGTSQQCPLKRPSARGMSAVATLFLLSSIPVARAADSGDDFANNLFSDLAPILALFGEQVVKQFMSESSGWADNVLFAMAPLGVITGVVSAIRVAGHPWLKALVGRAKECLAQAEMELMSSNSPDVGEMWNGQAVVRVLGRPSIFQFIYTPDSAHVATAPGTTASPGTATPSPQPQTQTQNTPPGSAGNNTPPSNITGPPSPPAAHGAGTTTGLDLSSRIDVLSDSNAFFRRRDVGTALEQRNDRGHDWHDNADIEMRPLLRAAADVDSPQEISTEDNPPNISLNARGKHIGDREKWSMAALAVAAQLAVLVFDYFISFNERLKTHFLKDGKSPSPRAFPCTIVGTVCLTLGMLLCSYVVDSASTEETWVLKDQTSNCKVAWIQRAATVNDQEFDPYLIFGHQGQQKIRTSHRCHPRSQLKLRFWVLVATAASLAGFVTQFIGLRGMHWSATIAQLVATAFVTALRSFARRRMSKEPIVSRAVKGYELDCMARKVRDCLGWKIISEIPPSVPAEQRDGLAHDVVRTRRHLAHLSGWPSEIQDTADAVCAAMEQTLNYVSQSKGVQLRSSAEETLEFRFTLAALALKEAHPPGPSAAPSHHYGNLTFRFTRRSRWEQWKMDDDMNEEVSSVLSLWRLHSVEEESYYNKGHISPGGKDLEDIQRVAQVLPWPSHATHRRVFELWMGSHEIHVLRKHPQDISRDPASPVPTHRIIGTSKPGEDPHAAIHQGGSVKKLFAQQIFSAFLSELLTSVSEITGPAEKLITQHKLQGLRHDAVSQLGEIISETGLGTRQEVHMLLVAHFGDHKLLPPPDRLERAREAHFRAERALRKSRLENKWHLTALYSLNLLSDHPKPRFSAAAGGEPPAANVRIDELDVRCMARRFITRIAAFISAAEETPPKPPPSHSMALFLQWLGGIDLKILQSLPTTAPVTDCASADSPLIDGLICNASNHLDHENSQKITVLLEKFRGFEKEGYLADPHCLTWKEVKPLRRLMDSQDQVEIAAIMEEATEHGYISVLEALLDLSPSLQHLGGNSLAIASAQDGPTVYHLLTQLFWYFPAEYRQFQKTQQPLLLFKAAELGNRSLMRELLKHNMRELTYQYRQSCMVLAAWNDHQMIIDDLLEDGVFIHRHVPGRYNKALLLTRSNHRDEWLRHEWVAGGSTGYWNSSPPWTEIVKGPPPGGKGDYRAVVDEFLRMENIPMAINAITVRSALQAAAERGHLSMVRHLVEKGGAEANTGGSGRSWSSALQAAAGGGHIEVVEMLIKFRADVNQAAWGYSGRTPLQAAAEYGDLAVVELLLAKGAKPIPTFTPSPDGGLSALAAATKGGHLAVVKRLLQETVMDLHNDINQEEWDQAMRSALGTAAYGGDLAVVNELLEFNKALHVERGSTYYDGQTALQASAGGGHVPVLDRLLLDPDLDINAGPAPGYVGGRTALQAAAGGGHLAATNWLLERNADVNAPASDCGGRTALQAAAEGGHFAVVLRLLERGADVNAAPGRDRGRTALQAAAAGGGYPEDVDQVLKVVNLLLERNADINAPASDSGGRTALQAAAASGQLPIVSRLLERGAEVNAAPAKLRGQTALQAAAESGHLAVVDLLLGRGADVNAAPAEHSGRTALQAAAGNGYLAIANRLLERNADVNATPAGDNGRTALQAAAQGGHLAVLDLLLEHKAEVNAPATALLGRTALQEAAENGHLTIVKRLLEHGADVNAAAAKVEGVKALGAARKEGFDLIAGMLSMLSRT